MRRDPQLIPNDELEKTLPVGVALEKRAISNHNQELLCSRYGDIHSSVIISTTAGAMIVKTG